MVKLEQASTICVSESLLVIFSLPAVSFFICGFNLIFRSLDVGILTFGYRSNKFIHVMPLHKSSLLLFLVQATQSTVFRFRSLRCVQNAEIEKLRNYGTAPLFLIFIIFFSGVFDDDFEYFCLYLSWIWWNFLLITNFVCMFWKCCKWRNDTVLLILRFALWLICL